MRRATLRLTLACNNACVFCAQEGLAPRYAAPSPEPIADRLAAIREGADELTLVGGEPTIDPSIVDVVREARAAGFVGIGIQTNGRRLAEVAFTESLARAGLTDVHVSLHGAESAAHDYHTGVDGSFVEATAGLRAARGSGLTTVVTTVLTRSNFRVLSGIPRLLLGHGVGAWAVRLARVAGRTGAGFDRIVPRFGMAVPFALHAIEAARAAGLPAFIQGAPLCALGPLASRALPDEERAYDEVCATCSARPTCPGVDPVYLTRFGAEELSARQRPLAPVSGAGIDRLARMFVGVGELALGTAPLPAEVSAPPARARASLPVLGKVQPAANEVPVSAPKKSGEALRALFPDLFGARAKDDLGEK